MKETQSKMNPNITWYPINRDNVKHVIASIPDGAIIWIDFGCRDCHRNSIQCEEDPRLCAYVTHNCVKEYGRDYVVTKRLCHAYPKFTGTAALIRDKMCHGMSCDGKCITLNAIGIDKNSDKKHDMELRVWKLWWKNFAEWHYPLQQLCLHDC